MGFFADLECAGVGSSVVDDCAEITTPPPRFVVVDVDPVVVPAAVLVADPAPEAGVPLDGDGEPASVDCSASRLALSVPPTALPVADVAVFVGFVGVSVGVAHATPGVVATAAPNPKATASAPTRPMCLAAPWAAVCETVTHTV